ncbi:Protein of unknown function, partial [Cotesia congregata]
MAIVPNRKIKNTSNVILLCLMLMAVYSHHRLDDKLERTAPALVFLFMLTGRLVIDSQLSDQSKEIATVNGMDEKIKKQE